MTKRELKRLSRADLLELLLQQSKENQQLKMQVEELEQKLADRIILIENSGSLAEAAFSLNHVFSSAQAACDQYTENVRQQCARLEQETRKKCERILEEARWHAEFD